MLHICVFLRFINLEDATVFKSMMTLVTGKAIKNNGSNKMNRKEILNAE